MTSTSVESHREAPSFHPLSPPIQRDPYPHYRHLRDSHPVAFIESLGWYLVTRYADVQRVLRSPSEFSSSIMRRADPTLLGQDPPVHTRVRRMLSPSFSASEAKKGLAALERAVRPMVSAFVQRSGGDVVAELSASVAASSIARVLAIDDARWGDFKHWTDAVVRGASGTIPAHEAGRAEALAREFNAYIGEVVQRRRHTPESDVISMMLRPGGAGGVSDDEVRSVVKLLLIAGNETTTHLIGNALLAMLATPQLQNHLRGHPNAVELWVEETLRFDAPVQLILRCTQANMVMHGVDIPKRAVVAAVIGSANRDARSFADPDKFHLERRKSALAFGAGPHLCLGAHLARMVAQLVLRNLLQETRHIRAAEDLNNVERVASVQLRGPQRLLIAAT